MRSLTIPGEPMAKARPKFYKGFASTPAKTVNYEVLVKELYAVKYGQEPLLEGPLALKVTAHMSIPKSASKKARAAMLAGMLRPTKRPDTDNVLKIIADALNGICYADDAAIVSATVEKYWSDQPRVEVEICQLGQED